MMKLSTSTGEEILILDPEKVVALTKMESWNFEVSGKLYYTAYTENHQFDLDEESFNKLTEVLNVDKAP